MRSTRSGQQAQLEVLTWRKMRASPRVEEEDIDTSKQEGAQKLKGQRRRHDVKCDPGGLSLPSCTSILTKDKRKF